MSGRGARRAWRLARPWLARVGLALGSLAGCVLAVEGWLRWSAPEGGFVLDAVLTEHPEGLYQQDGELGQALAPGADVAFRTLEYATRVRVNSLGLRGPEPEPGGRRVLALGDSFTMAAQVDEEQAWPARLQAALAERSGQEVQVFNAGVDGYGTFQEVAMLQRVGRRLEVEAAVLAFYLGNDFRDNHAHREPWTQPRPLQDPRAVAAWEFRRDLARRWASLSRIYATWLTARLLRSQDFRVEEYRDEVRIYTDPSLLAQTSRHTAEALGKLSRTCEELEIACLVALIPPAYAVDSRRAAATFEAFGLDAAEADLEAPARAVSEAAGDLEVLDLSPALRQAGGRLYYTYDPHWTPAAHDAAGRAIAEALAPRLFE